MLPKELGMKPLLIIGIDPGTTLAYAVLGLDGNVVKVNSSKQLDLDSLTAEIFLLGKPLIVATDVSPVPKFVEKFASQTGSRIISPRQSLKIIQKKELTKDYSLSNDHERDALSSAIFAFKKIRALLEKINFYVRKHNKEALKRNITRLVVSKDVSISDAVSILEKKEVEPEIKKPKMRTEPIKVKFDEVKYLREQNERLKSRLAYSENKLKDLENSLTRISDRRVKDLISFKEKKISFLNKEIREHKEEIERLNKKVSSLKDLLSGVDKFLVIPKFKSLSLDEIEGKELKEAIFVDDPSSFSEKALDLLKGKVSVIIHSGPVSRMIRDKFIFIDIKNLEAVIEDRFILVDKSKFNEEISKVDILAKVVEEYKKERG